MEKQLIKYNEVVYLLLLDELKFWEISNRGSRCRIRKGKLVDGVEISSTPSSLNFASPSDALNRATQLIQSKINKGYGKLGDIQIHEETKQTNNPNNRFAKLLPNTGGFCGTYLEALDGSNIIFVCVQINKKHVKIEKGQNKVVQQSEIIHFTDENESYEAARDIIQDYLSKGYIQCHKKFKFTFNQPPQNQEDIELIITPHQTPIKLQQAYDRKLPQVRKIDLEPDQNFKSVEEMLRDIKLERYAKVFEQERVKYIQISPREFLSLNERELMSIQIPISARKIILDALSKGLWVWPTKRFNADKVSTSS